MIGSLIRELENNYTQGTITSSKYVQKSMYEDISTIDAYLNSVHISGEKDSLDRDKPFFNIVLAARNIWFRATDLDRKNIRVKAKKSNQYIISLIANVLLQDYMKRENFGQFLNDWGLTLSSYGSAVVKFVEKEGRLHTNVVDWNTLIVDPISFENNPVIEVLQLTPAELRKRNYDQEAVDELIKSVTTRTTLDRQHKDNNAKYIKLYEIHGELPLSYLTDKDKDKDEYVQQVQVVSYLPAKKKGEYEDFVLYKGKEKNPYMITHLIEKDGQTLAEGAVQSLFQSQWMVNHSIKAIKDQLDLDSKIIFQTADSNYASKSVLSAVESGDILTFNGEKAPNGITRINNSSLDTTALMNFGQQWRDLAQEISSTPDILQGANLPSGTAYRQAAIVQQEAHSNFEQMIENKGLALELMLREHILPHLKKKMNTSEEISAILEDQDLNQIDAIYMPREAVKRFNRKAVEAVLNESELPNLGQEMQGVQQDMSILGKQRFFKPSEVSTKTWKEVLKDFEWDIEVEITNENVDKQSTLDTLNTVFQTIAQTNGAILQNPDARKLFNIILETTGQVSPLQLSAPQMMQTSQQPIVGAGTNQQIQ